MTANLNRWWAHIWKLPTWKALFYLFLVAFRALMTGGGILFVLSDVPTLPRAIIAAVAGVGLSVTIGITGLRVRLGEDW